MRLQILDGLRGYFLVFMVINHLVFAGGYLLQRLNHAELGFVQDAQGFVFVSGLLAGMVYGRRWLRDGASAAAASLWRRAAEIYAYAILCIAVILALAAVLPDAPAAWWGWLGNLPSGGLPYLSASALMIYQPTFLDILPQYVIYMALTPPLLLLCLSGRWLAVALGSALLWATIQLGAHVPLANAIHAALGSSTEAGPGVRASFNVFAWQIVFFGGLIPGALLARKDLDVAKAFDPARTMLVQICSALLLFFLAWRLCFTFELMPNEVIQRFRVYENRVEFGAVFLLNFAALAYAFTWLVIAGPKSESAAVRKAADLAQALFTLPILRLLGRHSLQVYAFHVPLIYLVCYADVRWGPFPEAAKTAIALACVAALVIPALIMERLKSAKKAAPAKLADAPA
jgi:hypothetical protein